MRSGELSRLPSTALLSCCTETHGGSGHLCLYMSCCFAPREMPATDAGAVCRVQLEAQGAPLLSLSADESLLAVCSGHNVEVGGWAIPRILQWQPLEVCERRKACVQARPLAGVAACTLMGHSLVARSSYSAIVCLPGCTDLLHTASGGAAVQGTSGNVPAGK